MKTLRIAALPVVAALVLTACSSSTPGTATATGTTAATTSSEATTSSATSTTSASSTGDTSVTPAELDEDSINWFNTFCGSFADVIGAQMSEGMSAATATASSPQEQQATQVAMYTALGSAMTETADTLSSEPPPGFENGEQAAVGIITALETYGAAATKAAEDLAAATVTTQEELDAAVEKVEADIDATEEGLDQALGGMDELIPPDVEAAVEQLPACAFMGSGSSSTTTS